MKHKSELIMDWSAQDVALVAEVPEVPGCASDGRTYAEAPRNVGTVTTVLIETAREVGRPIPEASRLPRTTASSFTASFPLACR